MEHLTQASFSVLVFLRGDASSLPVQAYVHIVWLS